MSNRIIVIQSRFKSTHDLYLPITAVQISSVVAKTFFRSRDRDLDKMNSSALESRDHGLEITTLAASVLDIGDRALA